MCLGIFTCIMVEIGYTCLDNKLLKVMDQVTLCYHRGLRCLDLRLSKIVTHTKDKCITRFECIELSFQCKSLCVTEIDFKVISFL